MTILDALKRALTIIAVILGVGALRLQIGNLVNDTQFFTDPRFADFWDEVKAFHLKKHVSKPLKLQELRRRFGESAVARFVEIRGDFSVLTLPSEEVTYAILMGGYFSAHPNEIKRWSLNPFAWGLKLILLFLLCGTPIITARQLQRFILTLTCQTQSVKQVMDAYFVRLKERRIPSIILAFVVTFGICLVSALFKMPPALRDKGMTVVDFAVVLTVLGYFGGFWITLLTLIVDTILLVVGVNPHCVLWDDVIAIAVMAPILAFVYQNSLLTVLTFVIAGLTAGLYIKWVVYRDHLRTYRSRSTLHQ